MVVVAVRTTYGPLIILPKSFGSAVKYTHHSIQNRAMRSRADEYREVENVRKYQSTCALCNAYMSLHASE